MYQTDFKHQCAFPLGARIVRPTEGANIAWTSNGGKRFPHFGPDAGGACAEYVRGVSVRLPR
eukprot:2800994-Pyramimonas_sp.AAC.1